MATRSDMNRIPRLTAPPPWRRSKRFAPTRVNRAPTQCDYLIYAQAAALSKGWAAESVTIDYQYYVPGASALASDPGTWASGACPTGGRTPRLIQLVTVTITSPSGDINRSVKVVKSDV